MVKFLETTGVTAELTELIKTSEEKLFLISPYLQISDRLRHLIKERDSRKIDIRVIYRTDELKAEEMRYLQELTSIKLLSCENLHAKCYLNENTAIITSMNIFRHSQENNWEMGIKIEKETDQELYKKILDEVMLIIQNSQQTPFSINKIEKEAPVHPKGVSTKMKKPRSFDKGGGFCIRCGTNLKINMEKPLCIDCYKSWAEYCNKLYKENFCHVCGQKSDTTYEKPVCRGCYKKINK